METEVKWRRWLGCYFQWGLWTCATQTCFWKQTGGVAHVCKRFTRACRLFKSRIHAAWKKKTKKQKQHVYQERAELEYIPFTFIINLDFPLWEKAEPRKISLILKQLRVKCSGATGQWFQTCSFWCRLQLCSSWTPGHQSSRFLDTSARSGSGCADSSLGTSPCSQIWIYIYIFANLLLHVCYLHMCFEQSSSVVNTLQSACLSDCVYY